MVAFPSCKINLGLQVLRKRPDGYHDIETCFYPIPYTDILEILPSNRFEFTHTGLEIPGSMEDNLCAKAYRLLQHPYNLGPVRIHLHKVVPMGAGLGGGSSDAAYVLRLLNQFFNLNLPLTQLHAFASTLGSDCAFFLHDKPMIGRGRGEELSEVQVALKGKFIVVIHPAIHVSTADAYKNIKIKPPVASLKDIVEQTPLNSWRDTLTNVFEDTVFPQHPLIKELKETLYRLGAVYASMSGSGSAVFGIFEREVPLIRDQFKPYSVWSGSLTF